MLRLPKASNPGGPQMSMFRRVAVTGLAVAGLALSAAPAFAQGGSGGGGGTPPTTVSPEPVDPWAVCPAYIQSGTLQLDDGSTLFGNTAGIGCLVARSAGGSLSIYQVTVAAGWVSSITTSDPSKLDVQFTNPST